jgi:hypothetical protein
MNARAEPRHHADLAVSGRASPQRRQQTRYWGQMIVINPSNDAEAYIGIPAGGGLWHVTGNTSAARLDPQHDPERQQRSRL